MDLQTTSTRQINLSLLEEVNKIKSLKESSEVKNYLSKLNSKLDHTERQMNNYRLHIKLIDSRISELEKEQFVIYEKIDSIKKNGEKKFFGFGKLKNEYLIQINDLNKINQKLNTNISFFKFNQKPQVLDHWAKHKTDFDFFNNIRKEAISYLEKLNKKIKHATIKKLAKIIKNQRDIIKSYQNQSRSQAEIIRNTLATNHPCPYCGRGLGVDCHADHIYPVSKGGLSTQENMIMVCTECNLKKGNLSLRKFLKKYNFDRDTVEKRLVEHGKYF